MRIPIVAVALVFITLPVIGQPKTTFTLQQENDSYFSGTDRGYTNGTRLLWTWEPATGARSSRIPDWMCRETPVDECRRMVSAGVGLTIYTPTNLGMERPILGDRPYGGWLYGTMMFDAIRSKTADHVEVAVGVIGNHSYAEQAQVFIHRHVTPEATDPRGWDNQIGEWPALHTSYERSIKLLPLQTASGIDWFDITPALGASAGNVFISGSASATVRLGYNLPQRFVRAIPSGPLATDVQETAPDTRAARNWDFYVFGGGNVSYVARNIFIDAEDTTYRIAREPNVQGYRAGASMRLGRIRLAYQHTWRSAEFEARVRRSPVTGQSWDTIMISVGPNP